MTQPLHTLLQLHNAFHQRLVVAINKMETVNYDETAFRQTKVIFEEYLVAIHWKSPYPVIYLPVSGLEGENLITASSKMEHWKQQPEPLLRCLDRLHVTPKYVGDRSSKPKVSVEAVYTVMVEGQKRICFVGTVEEGIVSVRSRRLVVELI